MVKKVVAVENWQMWNPYLLCLVRQSDQTWNMCRKLLFMNHTQQTQQTSFLSYCKSNIPGTYACNLFTL